MHLLFTDPSTSPRTELGRLIFGVMYGLAVVTLFGLLGKLGMPTFYDKLLAVPLMNLTIQGIDGLVRSGRLRAIDPARWGTGLAPRRRHLAYMAVWGLVFLFMLDPADAYKPRRWVPVWQQACERDLRNGCQTLSLIETSYCRQGSPWACNELGLLQVGRGVSSPVPAAEAFARACGAGMKAACANRERLATGVGPDRIAEFGRAPPSFADWPILVQEGQGVPQGLGPAELVQRACRQGWAEGCQALAGVRFAGRGTARDVPGAVTALEQACQMKLWASCADLGVLLQTGDGGVPVDAARGTDLLQRACDGGFQRACARLQGGAATKPSSP